MRSRALLSCAALVAAPLALPLTAGTAGAATARAETRQIAYTSWDTGVELGTGTTAGTQVARGKVRLDGRTTARRTAGATYDTGTWTSAWTRPGFAFTELVPSWEATTPVGTFVEVRVRGRAGDGTTSSWDVLGRWASHDKGFRRASSGSQPDDLASVATDTWTPNRALASWQLRVTLFREAGSDVTPRVDAAGAMASRIPSSTGVSTSAPGAAGGVTLPVPKLSQMVHQGHFPQYGGGGEAWCSPTSLAMVLGYYDALPSRAETAWVGDHNARVVDHLARMTYDYRYEGTGNWPFNTAYAATRVEQAFVTRFASLRGVERMVKAGIPVITSITFGSGQLRGAPIGATNGHLLVVVGFTAAGDVVVNDPAADPRQGENVRRTYDRGQFEDAWLKRGSAGGSGGIAYVVRDAAHPLPARNGATSW